MLQHCGRMNQGLSVLGALSASKQWKNCLFLGFVFLTTVGTSFGNNIAVSNVSLTGRDVSAGANNASNFVMVKFDLSWENSWRLGGGPANWDAAWVFVKYRLPGGNWQHAWLNNIGHTAASGSTIDRGLLIPGTPFNASTNPGLGVFIYRSSAGNGNVNFSNLQLRWNYGAQGISDGAAVDVQVFAIEMVYVPQGSFYLGSGGTESGSFTDGSWSSGATIPFLISSEAALGIDNVAGKLWGTSTSGNNTIGNVAADAEATLPAAFPKGFADFYCMKYEISQGQYRDFLNTLDYTQQVQRTATVPTSSAGTGALIDPIANRQGIEIQTPGVASTTPAVYACNLDNDGNYNEAEDGEWIACNFLNWADGCAYMDWSGLRPFTELEFEKACRGIQFPVTGEYSWGTASTTSANNITNPGANNEFSNTSGANSASATQPNVNGPLRVGSFAGAATTRTAAGASYWGIMELSGNLSERPITVGNSAGRAYTGLHGNGELSSNGRANVSGWPTLNADGEVNSAIGSGLRGGSYGAGIGLMSVSARTQGAATNGTRFNTAGFRGVRNAPLL
jgi:formylglycine-generating enzyme required for sulfatase activity